MSARLTLTAGALRVALAPEIGGSIARFDRIDGGNRQPLLRGTDEAAAQVLDMSCFPLVPYANRIRGGSFVCDGRTVTLRPNLPGDPSPLHGDGWLAAWTVLEASDTHAVLEHRHAADEWPWDYRATQRFELDEGGLSLRLDCTNLSAEPMPCGLGFHPYYVCDGETVIDTGVTHAWTVNKDILPVERVPAAGRYGLRERKVCGEGLDNGFDGWSGTADFRWLNAPAALRLTSPDARRFQVYAPETGGLFAAEPVQNANCALNAPQEQWADLGITMLAQGESAAIHARYDVLVA